MVHDFGPVHAMLMQRPWRILVASDDRYFVTSDNPVVFDRDVGLRASTLLFPVSRTVLLEVSPFGGVDLEYEPLTALAVRKMNALIIRSALNEVYSPYPDQWIHTGLRDGFTFTGSDA
jgi:hypothetical protein